VSCGATPFPVHSFHPSTDVVSHILFRSFLCAFLVPPLGPLVFLRRLNFCASFGVLLFFTLRASFRFFLYGQAISFPPLNLSCSFFSPSRLLFFFRQAWKIFVSVLYPIVNLGTSPTIPCDLPTERFPISSWTVPSLIFATAGRFFFYRRPFVFPFLPLDRFPNLTWCVFCCGLGAYRFSLS